MQPIQIVSEVLNAIDAHDLRKASARTAEDLVVTDPTLAGSLDKAAFFAQMDAILTAFPDWKYDLESLDAEGKRVTVSVVALATNTAPLKLPGMPVVPATGKHVSIPDRFVFTVENDHVTELKIDSPPNGGAAAMLSQLGITAPPSAS
jgi:predicted ester cyclase